MQLGHKSSRNMNCQKFMPDGFDPFHIFSRKKNAISGVKTVLS